MKQTNSIKDNWDAKLYDGQHAFVAKFGKDLIELLSPKEGENILDLGCGTGELADQLCHDGIQVTAVDRSQNMIQQAQKKFPNVNFIVQDALKLDYINEFDAVFSNAVLHWIKPPKEVLLRIYRSLKQGGRFVAEFGGKGNVQFIMEEVKRQFEKSNVEFVFPWYFPSIGEYSSLMEEVGFKVTYAHHFDRPTRLEGVDGLQHWMEMFTGNVFEGLSKATKEEIISNVERRLENTLFHKEYWMVDYKRLRIIGMKE